MSSPPPPAPTAPPAPTKTCTDYRIKAPMFTAEGLPLDHARFGIVIGSTDVGNGSGPARRIDCRPPKLFAAPSVPSKVKSTAAPHEIRLRVGPNNSSLIDDDDDELVDYFGRSGGVSAPFASPSAIAKESRASSSHWKVREHNVPTIPSFYPLDRSAVFVPRMSSSILACRITAVLQARSIVASFNARNAKVNCVSNSHVEFCVRLYRGRGEYKHGIIVEVKRRLGFDIRYMQDVYAILDAAEGKSVQDSEGGNVSVDDEYFRRSCSSGEKSDVDSIEGTADSAALRIISDIICPQDSDKSATVEGRDFALASLASLTSVDRMGQAALSVSNEFLISEAYSNLRHAVFSNISPLLLSQGQDFTQHAILRSLEIMANVATSTQNSSLLEELFSQNNHDILEKLITNIENAEHNPRAADFSCRITKSTFEPQAQLGGTTIPKRCRERLLSALMKSAMYEKYNHADLERHSQHCFEAIQHSALGL